MQINMSNVERTQANYKNLGITQKIVIFAAPFIYFNFTVDDWLKTFKLRYI